jgi:hypothetical protein
MRIGLLNATGSALIISALIRTPMLGETCASSQWRTFFPLAQSLSGAPEDDVNGDPFLSLAGVRFSTHLRKVLVAPTIPMEDQDSEEYCEVTALAVEMMRPSGCHNE